MAKALCFIALVFAVSLLGGCFSRPEATPSQLAERDRLMVAHINATRTTMAKTVVERMGQEAAIQAAGGPTAVFDMLILSGGGEWGAFGAGFLNGWGQVPKGNPLARPHFDAVTGISTGALIAPFAFLGDEASLAQIEAFYCGCHPSWMSPPTWYETIFGDGHYWDSTGLEAVMRKGYSLDLVRRIAAQRQENRMLLVASTDLDLSRQAVWDMVEESKRAVERNEATRIHQILRASIAIPGMFRPVELDGSLHADGGLIEQFFVATDPQQCWAVLSGWKAKHPGMPMPKVRFWVLVNNQLRLERATTQPGWVSSVTRSILVMNRIPGLVGPLHDLWLYTQYLQKNGIDIEFRWTAIPEDFPVLETGIRFDPLVTNPLARLGRQMGADPASWHNDAPVYFGTAEVTPTLPRLNESP